MNATHMPGDWSVVRLASPDYAPQFGIYAEEGTTPLAIVVGENAEANAPLLAASKELLAALEGLLADPYLSNPINNDRMAPARAAIAKARGKA